MKFVTNIMSISYLVLMFNLKIAIRNLFRNGIYSGINVAGLAVSLTAVIIIALWVENEMTFDRWYSNTDNLYLTGISDEDEAILNSSEPLFKTLQKSYPEVKRVAHFMNDKDVILYTQDDEMNGFNDLGAWVDSTIFKMLDVKFIRGSAQVAFKPAFPIVLSEGLAKKLFGDEDPIGQTLRVNNYTEAHQVTGIFREQPKNTSFRFQWLMPFAVNVKRHADAGWNPENDWNTYYFKCWVELHPNADVIALNEKLKIIGNERIGSDIFLYPVSRHYLYGEFADGKPVASKRVREIQELSFIALIILLIACINFTNLATARSEKRMMEMGVRKTFGAKRAHLIGQLMRESALLTVTSITFALLIIWTVMPLLDRFWNLDLSVNIFDIRHLCGILITGVSCTVLSGIYPAFYVSAYHPNDILKKLKNRASNSATWIRRGLVMFQFAASFVLICMTIALFLQIRLGQHRPLGYDKEHLLRVSGVGRIANQFPVRDELGKSAFITKTALADDPLVISGNAGSGYQWQGKTTDINPMINRSYVTPGYVETVGFKLLEGRDFYEGSEADARSVIINKTFADMMGDEGTINNELWVGDWENAIIYTIVGIIDDYICNDVYRTQGVPMMLYKNMGQRFLNCLYVRFDSKADIANAFKSVQSTLSMFPADNPLEYAFVDDLVNRMFESQRQQGFMVALFSILSVLVSCLGLFGLVTYIAESKTKEIGIRKILGASTGDLVRMLTKEFLILVTISSFVAFPLAYWWINQMLQGYGYRITVGWELYVLTMLITLLLTLFTVGWQARKASTANPANAIKTE